MNEYFNLELRIPRCSNTEMKTISTERAENLDLCRFGFIPMLKKCFGENLLSENVWFTGTRPSAIEKRVRFKTLEVSDDELPYCRRDCTFSNMHRIVSQGHLHDPSCKNYKQETVGILGDKVFQNRQFMLQWLIEKLTI